MIAGSNLFFFFLIIWNMLCLCRSPSWFMSLWPSTIKILISNLPRTPKFSQLFKNTGEEQPRPQGLSLKNWVGRENALASAGHVSPCTPWNPGCNKLALCEKLKLCVTSQRAILGGLLYPLTINEKFYTISFLSQILAVVILCFPPISMKGTASGNICKTSVYRDLYRAI